MREHYGATYQATIYIAGCIETAKQELRRECYPPNQGLCITVSPTTFIYTGGVEDGIAIGFANYPRFPATPESILARAKAIAEKLMPALCQWSAMIVASDRTIWLTCRPEDQIHGSS